MEKPLLLILIMTTDIVADQLTPAKSDVKSLEGNSTKLECLYTTSSENVLLYWYKQYPNEAPQYILYKGARSWSGEKNIPDPRFDSTTSRRSTELIITDLSVADTALYYCALRDVRWVRGGMYVRTDKLTFGTKISLTVTPKNPPTSLPTMSILDGKVCLAEAFGKNTGNMTVTTGSRPTSVDVSDAVLARTTKAYYFAAFETDITECSLQSQTAIKENTSQPPVTSAEKQTESPPVNCDDNNTNQTAVAPAPDPKMNFMSVLVTGLRIVFAKAVAINVIMTVKVLVM